MKKKCFLGLLVFVLVIGFIGCGGDDDIKYTCTPCKDEGCVKCDPNIVGNREIIRYLFVETNYFVTVKGVFNKADLEDAADAIAGRIDSQYTSFKEMPEVQAFFARGVIYIVESEQVGYVRYKTIGDGKTIYIALDRVDTPTVTDGTTSIWDSKTIIDGVEVAQVRTHDKGWKQYKRHAQQRDNYIWVA